MRGRFGAAKVFIARGIRFQRRVGLARTLRDGMDYGNCMLPCWPGKGESRPDRRFADIRETGQLGGRALAASPTDPRESKRGRALRQRTYRSITDQVGTHKLAGADWPAAYPTQQRHQCQT